MHNRLLGILLFTVCSSSVIRAQTQYPFQNPKLPAEDRVTNIISLMTLEEKVAAFRGGAVPRLQIPTPGGSEGIHQVVGGFGPKRSPATSFSQVYGMGETWDPALMLRAGTVEGVEARYKTQSPKYMTSVLMLQGPTSDLARDPRWGRNDESFGEDPFLTGSMATAFAEGIQGNDPQYWQAVALLKHFFANSNETTRMSSSSDFDERLMREYYSVPFRMAFTVGGAKSYMSSYNAWNGIPMVANPVLRDVVAKEWGANYIISTDAGALQRAVDSHKYFKDAAEATAAAIKVGTNQLLADPAVVKEAMDKGLLTEADINAALRGRFMATIKLGLLDPPGLVPYSKIGTDGQPEPWDGDVDKGVARQVARESIVLLKDSNSILPLDKSKVRSIAVVGPRADKVLFDFYSGVTPYAISILQGIKDKVGEGVKVGYAANNDGNAAVNLAKSSDVVIVAVGNDPMCGAVNPRDAFNHDGTTKPCANPSEGREGRDRTEINLPDEQLVKDVYAANPHTVLVLVSSFPYAINWSEENVPAIMHVTHAAQEQGTAVADVLFGDYNPGGRLTQTWPKSLDQLPPIEDYNIRNGRTYMYFKGEPLYPFGFGLSYTNFKYSDLKVKPGGTKTDVITGSVEVTNTGSRSGDDVVQLYASFPASKVEMPKLKLVGFKRVTLAAGETKTVDFSCAADQIGYWSTDKHAFVVENGKVQISAGGSSADLKLSKIVAVR
jgi:beta-glucosidase